MKNCVQVIRRKPPYRIENWVCKAGSKFGFTFWIWAGTIPQKNILGDYFIEGGLDLHFIGADPSGAVPQHGQAQKHSYNYVYILSLSLSLSLLLSLLIITIIYNYIYVCIVLFIYLFIHLILVIY